MKLTNNEKTVLELLITDPRASNTELAKDLGISSQGVGKIKRGLKRKEIIESYETTLNYKNIGIRCFALSLVKIMPKAYRRYKETITEVFSHPNIISLINLPQTNISHIILFGFRDVAEYDNFFMQLQEKLPGLIEIKETHVFSNESFIKNSASDLFIKMVKEFGEKKIKPRVPQIKDDLNK
ncbi:Lrp/AsnC family transcriptional regulator [Nanoarchaeota archaeon]